MALWLVINPEVNDGLLEIFSLYWSNSPFLILFVGIIEINWFSAWFWHCSGIRFRWSYCNWGLTMCLASCSNNSNNRNNNRNNSNCFAQFSLKSIYWTPMVFHTVINIWWDKRWNTWVYSLLERSKTISQVGFLLRIVYWGIDLIFF